MIQSLYQEGREGSIMSLSNAPSLFLLLLFILRSPIVEGSEKRNSAVSYTLCENSLRAEDTGLFILEVRSDSTPDQKYTVILGQDGNRTKFLNGKIEQNDVKFLKYESRHEICFQSLVVDTTIIIDQPTLLNKSCDGDDNRPCKKWASEIHPVPVCPEATKVTRYPRQVKFMDQMNSSPQYMTLLTICSKPLLTSPKVPPNYFVKL